MRTLSKITTTTAAAFLLIATAPMFVTPYAVFGEQTVLSSNQVHTRIDGDEHNRDSQVSSLRVTQSTEDGLQVECEGDLKCKIVGDDTIVATSEDNDTTTVTTTSGTYLLNQSDIAGFASNLDGLDHDLDRMIEGMVDRLLDEIPGGDLNSLAISG
ncbi:MAG TPA: hypothetical protein VJ695_03300 [Nitrososphaera sp.]|nr:hypothetical protein [Nitrososphaera sp.]